MERKRIYPRIVIFIAWLIWIFHVYIVLFGGLYPLGHIPFINPEETIQPEHQNINIAMISTAFIVVALIEGLITIALRHYALIKPSRKGTYTPYSGPLRFLIVGFLNWTFSTAIVLYGTLLHFMTGDKWPLLLFGAIGLPLLLYHIPRVGLFTKKERDPGE